MSDAQRALITRFYRGFQRLDAEAMIACYTEDIVFSDPAFGRLQGREVGDMWRMLIRRARDFSVDFDQVRSEDSSGQAHWVARYQFSQTGRSVVNEVQARFGFRDGLIAMHDDRFDLWRWSRQALGVKGLLLGWTPALQRAVQAQARRSLVTFSTADQGPAAD